MATNYTVNFSNTSKTPIIVVSSSTDVSTSLGLVGKDAKGYGKVFAENFLHLLENFASPTPPTNPIEGQIWYDTSDPYNKVLRVNDGAGSGNLWYPASAIHQAAVEPVNKKTGDIWVDISSFQLKIYNGTAWLVVGPTVDGSHKTGMYPEVLTDTNGNSHYVVSTYVDNVIISITASASFIPIITLPGFSRLEPGVNISIDPTITPTPSMNGVANRAYNLEIASGANPGIVSAGSFFRKDIADVISNILVINSDAGIGIGASSSTFFMQKINNDGVIFSTQDSSKIIFKVDKDGVRRSIMAVDGATQRVGINQLNPTVALDVVGSIAATGTIHSSVGGFVFPDGSVQTKASVFGASRTSFTNTASSVSVGNTSTIDISGFKSYALTKISTSIASRVRLYTDPTSRTNDWYRNYSITPSVGSGVVADILTSTSTSLTKIISPGIIGFNENNTNTVYLSVTNMGTSTSALSVTLTLLQLE